ncbi:MAG: cytochrome c biogenesis protein ResB [Bdellovibrionota bacterium]
MNLWLRVFNRVFEFLASLELAVFLILSMAASLAAGTIYESRYSAAIAGQMVYRAWWMQILLWLFMMNLAAVALSRLPWKRHHIGFLITHLGIIILLLGSWVTQRAGIDGVVALAPGESGRHVRMEENMLYVFRAVQGKTYELVVNRPLHFDLRHPLAKPESIPFEANTGAEKELQILHYYPEATRDVQAQDVKTAEGNPAVKIRVSGSRATFSEWMFLQPDTGTTRDLGPARVRFVRGTPDLSTVPDKPTLMLYLEGKPLQPPRVAVAKAGEKFRILGRAVPQKAMPLGWMDFEFTLDEYHSAAVPKAEYQPLEKPIPGFEPFQAIEVGLGKEKIWLELGAYGQISAGDAVYYVQFTRKQADLGFDIKLNKFNIAYYEGTTKPKAFMSEVEVAGQKHEISMNNPLHHGGFTFYQASYDTDPDGVPRTSVLSVNYDPGRYTKYAGSLMIVLGIISMFYFKPIYSGKRKILMSQKEDEV